MPRTFEDIRAEHLEVVHASSACAAGVEEFAGMVREALGSGGKVLFMGNGGSAADSQHLAAEFVGRFQLERGALPSVALTTDTSILTAVANDYGYDSVFERQVAALAGASDVVVGISTSGNSPNVLKALAKARAVGARTVGLTGGDGGAMPGSCDLCIRVPSKRAARVQEVHILIGHAVCELVEEGMRET